MRHRIGKVQMEDVVLLFFVKSSNVGCHARTQSRCRDITDRGDLVYVISTPTNQCVVAGFVGHHIRNLHMMLETVEQNPGMALGSAKMLSVVSSKMQDFQGVSLLF